MLPSSTFSALIVRLVGAVGHRIFEMTGELKDSEVFTRKKFLLLVLCAVSHRKIIRLKVFVFLRGLQYLGKCAISSLISLRGRSTNKVPCHSG